VRDGEEGDRVTGDILPTESPLGGGEVSIIMVEGQWLIDRDLTCITPMCD
jgi:hypothetical protein